MKGDLIDRTYTLLEYDLACLVVMKEEGQYDVDVVGRICELVTALDALNRLSA